MGDSSDPLDNSILADPTPVIHGHKVKKVVKGQNAVEAEGHKVIAGEAHPVIVAQAHKVVPESAKKVVVFRGTRAQGQLRADLLATSHLIEMRKHVIEQWTHSYLVLKLSMLVACSIALIVFGALAEPMVSGKFTWLVGILLMFGSILGIIGTRRVVNDLKLDDDGLETPGQRLLQAYFHIALGFLLLFTPFAVSEIRNPIGFEGDLVNKIVSSDELILREDLEHYLRSAGWTALLASFIIALSLRSVVKIVTIYEIAQSFLETFAATLFVLTVILLMLLASFLRQTSYSVVLYDEMKTTGDNETLEAWIWVGIANCLGLILLSILGFYAAWFEYPKLLLAHIFAIGIVATVCFLLGIAIFSIDQSEFISNNCASIAKTMSEDWWQSVTGCTKYGGTTMGALVEVYDSQEAKWHYVVNGVGVGARCPDSRQQALAWEYDPVADQNRMVDMVGCVNLACCKALEDYVGSFSFLNAFCFVLLLVCLLVAMRADWWLYKNTPPNTNEQAKKLSRERALVILGVSLFVAVLAIIIAFAFGINQGDRSTSDSTPLDDLASRIDKDNVHDQVPGNSILSSCTNGVMDGLETDIDCGGTGCAKRCIHGRGCLIDGDCIDGLSCDPTFRICGIPTPQSSCNNGIKDFLETDIDCGGKYCDPCNDGQKCVADTDCANEQCEDNVCISCFDGKKNGAEGDVDCGSPACVIMVNSNSNSSDEFDFNALSRSDNEGLCMNGATCSMDSQCASGTCYENICVSCNNNITDGQETDVDCGGPACAARCSDGENCLVDDDCASNMLCDPITDTCTFRGNITCEVDNIMNYNESGVDCGGSHSNCPRCPDGESCLTDGDCMSGQCYNSTCHSCFNGIRDGDESGIDCGGSRCATRCALGSGCKNSTDCSDGLFCWTERHVQVATDHYKAVYNITDDNVDPVTDIGAVFPDPGTCHVPYPITAKALSPIFFMSSSVAFLDLFEIDSFGLSNGTQVVPAGGNNRRRLTTVGGWPGSAFLETSGWPFLCTLTIESTVSEGNTFYVENANGAIISTGTEGDEESIHIEIHYQSDFPEIYIVKKSCDALRTIDIATRWTVGDDCNFLDVHQALVLGVSNLLVPLTTTIYGFVHRDECRVNPTLSDCVLNNVHVVLRAFRPGYCEDCSGGCLFHECDPSKWVDDPTYNANGVSKCLLEDAVEGYTGMFLPGLYMLQWPELFSSEMSTGHTVVIDFTLDGYSPNRIIVDIPVGGQRQMDIVYLVSKEEVEEEGSSPGLSTTSPTLAPTEWTLTDSPTNAPTLSPVPTETPTANPTLSPVPTESPTENPTTAPTQSPIPTETPTSAPSSAPTLSPVPTKTPTDAPTETPTSAPSSAPTLSPVPTKTPTDAPTETPTTAPSSAPTLSPVPTVTPTEAPTTSPIPTETPTSAPSSAPTLSPVPSQTPTGAPTLSPVPTETPTSAPSSAPTLSPVPTETPTGTPTQSPIPTETPTDAPTRSPTPTETPTSAPTVWVATDPPTNAPTLSPVPTESPTGAPTQSPVPTKTPTSAPSSAPTLSPVPTKTPTGAPTQSPIPTESPTGAPTQSPIPTETPTANPTNAPTVSPIPTETPTGAPTLSPIPTESPTSAPTKSPIPTETPTSAPTILSTEVPSDAPTGNPTGAPTVSPIPTVSPTDAPTSSPIPTESPTTNPTSAPTLSPVPTVSPTDAPTESPTANPTGAPTLSPIPTVSPTDAPTESPTANPTGAPTLSPIPTVSPTDAPTESPTANPTGAPTLSPIPTVSPTDAPTSSPIPTESPTTNPTSAPTLSPVPTVSPTDAPTESPTANPTGAPTLSPIPTVSPTDAPTESPTANPTGAPTLSPIPTVSPTDAPTSSPIPTETPTNAPSESPTVSPTNAPTWSPTNTPTKSPIPTETPTSAPTLSPVPTKTPTSAPTLSPIPTETPTGAPTLSPIPTETPTNAPSESPTVSPTNAPTWSPTNTPTKSPIPTETPTSAPTLSPVPTKTPTSAPTLSPIPTETPTGAPTLSPIPTETPTSAPSISPTGAPTLSPIPTETPTGAPTLSPIPTETPTSAPTLSPIPTETPTGAPTQSPIPTETPTDAPTQSPNTETPTAAPTVWLATDPPTNAPTLSPIPTETPTGAPTLSPIPTETPTSAPTILSTEVPSDAPTVNPTGAPTLSPIPTETPTGAPTQSPVPTETPTANPTSGPTSSPIPTETPTNAPTLSPVPTETPTSAPTLSPIPTETPTANPTSAPTLSPIPTETPTSAPTSSPIPTETPTANPTIAPTQSPIPTETPTNAPTLSPIPTETPTNAPTFSPIPTETPTNAPTESPIPTEMPTPNPTNTPTQSPIPTETPTTAPTEWTATNPPTNAPTQSPIPTETPSSAPTDWVLTDSPTTAPTTGNGTVVTPYEPDPIGLIKVDPPNDGNKTLDDLLDDVEEDIQGQIDNIGGNGTFEVDADGVITENVTIPIIHEDLQEALCYVRCNITCDDACEVIITNVNNDTNSSEFTAIIVIEESEDEDDGLSPVSNYTEFVDAVLDYLNMTANASDLPDYSNSTTKDVDVIVGVTPNGTVTDELVEDVSDYLENNVTIGSGNITYVDQCQTTCNGHGTCSGGKCTCETGYYGYQCQYGDGSTMSPTPAPIDDGSEVTSKCESEEWVVVYRQHNCIVGMDLGETEINEMFAKTGLMRYDRYGTPYVYYHRIRDLDGFDIYNNMLHTFSNTRNVLNDDFMLYSNELDLNKGENGWNMCYYNVAGIGFPNLCGPNSLTYARWCSVCGSTHVSATTTFSFHVCRPMDDVEDGEGVGEYKNLTGTITGTVTDEFDEPLPSTIRLYKGVVSVSDSWNLVPFYKTTSSGQSSFSFEGLDEGLYSMIAIPDDDGANTPGGVVNILYNQQDVRIVAPSTIQEDQLKVELEYEAGLYGVLDLVINFKVDSATNEECVVSSSTVGVGGSGCGDVKATSSVVSGSKVKQIYLFEKVHQTIYRFFLQKQSSLSQVQLDTGLPYRTDGRCGSAFPLASGLKSTCPTDEIMWDDGTFGTRPCCSPNGYCGSTESHCECLDCVDYRVFEEDGWKQRVRADGVCMHPFVTFEADKVAVCSTELRDWWDLTSEVRSCCSAEKYCSSDPLDCTCPTCIDFSRFDTSFKDIIANSTLPKTLEESNAKVIITKAGGTTSTVIPLPDGSIPENYFDLGEDSIPSSFVRMFCINAKDELAIHEYPAPRYFDFKGEMMDLNVNDCPSPAECEFISVSGMRLNSTLNGLYMMRRDFDDYQVYQAYPGYNVHPACNVQDMVTTLAVVDVSTCYDICNDNPVCHGFVMNGGTCRYYTQASRCGGKLTSADLTNVVYEKSSGTISSSSPSAAGSHYIKVDTLLQSNKVYLYRDIASTQLGGLYTFYFDDNLDTSDGHFAFGVDAVGLGEPQGVVQWLVKTFAWNYMIFLGEDPLSVSISKAALSCSYGTPSIGKNFTLQRCNCEGESSLEQAACGLPCVSGQSGECRMPYNASHASCMAPPFDASTPGTDHGCIGEMKFCGSTAYDPTAYTDCSDASSTKMCSEFKLRLSATNLCLARGRWNVYVVQCVAGDPHQKWVLSKEGYLVGKGVPSSISNFQHYYYTIGVSTTANGAGDWNLILQDPSNPSASFEPAVFEGTYDNKIRASVPSSGLQVCLSRVALGEVMTSSTDEERCATFELF